MRPKKAKEGASKTDVGAEGVRHQAYTLSLPHFFILF
jgi:hypothetical protein